MKLSEYIKPRGKLSELARETGKSAGNLHWLAAEGYNIVRHGKKYIKISKERIAYLHNDSKE